MTKLDKNGDDKTGHKSVLLPEDRCETLDDNSNKSRDNEMGIFLLYKITPVYQDLVGTICYTSNLFPKTLGGVKEVLFFNSLSENRLILSRRVTSAV